MYKLKDYVSSTSKPVYVHLPDDETARKFLVDAENQGFTFSDGAKPTEKHVSDLFVLHSDMLMNYVGFVGRTAYQCKADGILRIEYDDLRQGEK